MKKFHFKLETKLRLTVQEEKQALWEYHTRQYEWQQEKNELDRLKHQLEELWEYYREEVRAGAGIQQIIMIQQFVPVLKNWIQEQEIKTQRALEKMQAAEKIYLNLRAERKTLDKLKEREYQQYLLDWQREDQKIIDEIASMGFGRRQKLTGSR